jgi:hypothetical protein
MVSGLSLKDWEVDCTCRLSWLTVVLIDCMSLFRVWLLVLEVESDGGAYDEGLPPAVLAVVVGGVLVCVVAATGVLWSVFHTK